MNATTELPDTNDDISRMGALSDGIFGVALTLLMLDLRVPEASAGIPLARAVFSLWPKFYSYALTFAVVGAFWISHHRMSRLIARYDRGLLWINLLFLSLVALVPFPTSLVGRFSQIRADAQTAWIVYSINITLIGVSLFWLWRHALGKGLADDKVSPRLARYIGARALMAPVVFLLSIGLSLVSPNLAPFSILLMIPIGAMVRRTYSRPGPAMS